VSRRCELRAASFEREESLPRPIGKPPEDRRRGFDGPPWLGVRALALSFQAEAPAQTKIRAKARTPNGEESVCLPIPPPPDGGEFGCRYTPEMVEMLRLAVELRRKGVMKF